jgi:hypothetical protein
MKLTLYKSEIVVGFAPLKNASSITLDPKRTYIIKEGKVRDLTELIADTGDGTHYIPAVIEIESLPEVTQ